MKKIVFICILCFSVVLGRAQKRLNSIGITGGISYGNEKFFFDNPSAVDRKKYLLGFNGSVFLEYFNHDFFRWVTELQYNEKGSKDAQSSGNYTNKLQYGCWNNYLKIRYEMYAIIPYILIGPRLEYMINQSTSSLAITNKFLPLHVSPAVGAGLEFVSFGSIKFFVEAFYNPDMMYAYHTKPLDIYNKNFELRIGLKYQLQKRAGACNIPNEM